jgi:hypothetical protein
MNKNYSLQVVEQLVHNLNAAGIRYCHWKGTEHLSTTLTGQGDLDLLFCREDSLKVWAVFADLGFKNYPAPAWKYNSGIQDFVGFDETSGKIVHLHTYFRLIMGDLQLQEYRLPWEDDLLASVAPAAEDIPMPVPSPEAELLVLLVRSCLKTRFRDHFFRAAFRKTLCKDYERNRVWLCESIDESKLKMLSDKWLHSDLWPQVREAVFSPGTPSGILKIRKRVAAKLAKFRTYGPLESFIRARLREAAWVFGAINKRYLHWAIPWGRAAGNGGAIICILGADGSGKSTLTSETVRWLTYKLGAILRKKRQTFQGPQGCQSRHDCHDRSLSTGPDIRFQRRSPLAGFRHLAFRMDQSSVRLGAWRLSTGRADKARPRHQTHGYSRRSHIAQTGHAT